VRVATRVAADRWGEMVFEDDGEGIADDHLAKVFEPFFTTKPAGVGTGLGLSICQGIVDAHGGTIAIDSEVGRGTRVVVRLPLSEQASVAPAAPSRASTRTRLRVLVIDDDAAVARTLMRMVSSDHEVEIVNDGEQALALLERERFDVVLCDVMMPRRSGVEIYERVHDRDAAQANRFVMLTGGVFSPSLSARLDAHRLPCLSKPIDRTTLLDAIARAAEAT
jgi:CheY-like chemotaxis protein